MVLKTNHIATLTLFIVVYYCYASNDRLSVERRVDGDTFENPTCSDNSGCRWGICSNLNADCDSYYCQQCICKNTHKTFVPWIGKWGNCVKDDYLLFFPVGNSSFMVQDAQLQTPSMCISGDYYTEKTVCNLNTPSQRWIWTQDNQLWNVATSDCLQQNWKHFLPLGKEHLSLEKCDVATEKQKWECSSHKRFRLLNVPDRYMSYRPNKFTYSEYIIVSSNSSDSLRITWQRFQTGENLCSAFTAGCNGFTGSSAVFAADINCRNCYRPKRINVPTDSKDDECFIVWSQLQFLEYDKWTQLPFTEKIFKVYKYSGITYLKLDFTNASSRWTGLIVKLHFYCAQSQFTPPSNTRCVLIKFKGTANYPTAAPPKVPSTQIATTERSTTTTTTTTKTTTDTTTKISTSAATVTDASTPKGTPESKTDGIFPRFLSSHPTTSRPQTDFPSSTASLPNVKRHTGESSNVVLIVVPLVIVILVFCGILVGLVIYKKRRRPIKASQNEPKDSNDKGGLSVRQTFADTLNPIYSPADNSFAPQYSDDGGVYQEPTSGASQVCNLYESGGDHDYDYAKVDQNNHRAPLPEETYDYANSNDIRPVAQPNGTNKKTPKHACESKVEGEENTCPLYETLEDSSSNGLEMRPITNNNKKDPNESNVEGEENTSPVYQTLEDPYVNE